MSFEDYKTYEEIQHPTFQQSAMAHGYVDDSNVAFLALQSILSCSTPNELRAFVVTLTIEGYPTLCIWIVQYILRSCMKTSIIQILIVEIVIQNQRTKC